MSLDTKYRPRSYSDVLGQKVAIKTLKGFVQKDAGWRQSYLFAGPFGSGKTTLGRILARALLCDSPIDGEPCDECDSCLSMLNGSSPNFTEVDAATNSGKADIKKILEELEYSSFSGKKKLYLFDESHQLSPSALDALLKPMEENSKGSLDKKLVCIFATTEPEKMRATVLSRCAPAFIIHHVDSEEIADRLEWVCEKEGYTYERDALVLISDMSEGHIRDALKSVEGVALGNGGHIGVDSVRSYLHVDRNDNICKILISDPSECMDLVEDLVSRSPIGVLYDRLLTACMYSIEIGLGISNKKIPPYWDKEILTQAWSKYGNELLSFADQISSRPSKNLSSSMFKCDILKWKMEKVEVQKIVSKSNVETEIKKLRAEKTPPVEPVKPINKKQQKMSIVNFSKQVKLYMQNKKSMDSAYAQKIMGDT